MTKNNPVTNVNDSFHLEIRTVTIVPSTKNISDEISEAEFKKRILETKKFVTNLFGDGSSGGYTSVKAVGGYVIRNKTVEEKVAMITSYASKRNFNTKKKKWVAWLRSKKKQWGQDSIGIEIEDDLLYV